MRRTLSYRITAHHEGESGTDDWTAIILRDRDHAEEALGDEIALALRRFEGREGRRWVVVETLR